MSHAFHSDHQRLDERSLALHAAVAAKLQRDPALIERARQFVEMARFVERQLDGCMVADSWWPAGRGCRLLERTLGARHPAARVEPVCRAADAAGAACDL